MLAFPEKLIKVNMPIDFYVTHHPRMITAYFQCINGQCPIDPLADNLYDHIQKVIYENNEACYRMQRVFSKLERSWGKST